MPTCEDEHRKKSEEHSADQESKEKEVLNIRTPVYIGESSRSAYERGFEHLNDYTSLSSKSQMLKHAV